MQQHFGSIACAIALSLALAGYSQAQSVPAIAANGVVSASAFGGFSSIAPGSWIEIYGSNLATTTKSWGTADFNGVNAPTSLGGTSVTIGGKSAFIDYVSPGQVNAQVPSDVGIGPETITVITGSGSSAPYSITVNIVEPGLLATSAFFIGGNQNVVALFSDGTTYVAPPGAIAGVNSKRAQPGDVITLYGVGFGQVTPNIPAGQIVGQSNTLALPIHVLFGTTAAQLSYSGLAPDVVGLYQFNVTVPNISSSDAVPLTFDVGGVSGTQKLSIAIQNPGATQPALPQFQLITFTATYTLANDLYAFELGIYAGITGPGYNIASFSSNTSDPTATVQVFGATFDTVSVSGYTFTLSNVQTGPDSFVATSDGSKYGITDGNVTITLAPNGAPGVGNATGSFSVTSSFGTLTGALKGSYTAQ
jgi:uncharacterized protein (TIGR03437 family)